jgi:hypothetical protein
VCAAVVQAALQAEQNNSVCRHHLNNALTKQRFDPLHVTVANPHVTVRAFQAILHLTLPQRGVVEVHVLPKTLLSGSGCRFTF